MTPDLDAIEARIAAATRFWANVDKSGDCWLWTGSTRRRGYGRLRVGGRDVAAHRYAYELLIGPIPSGLVLDHLCRVTNCVNPAHLEPVTNKENVLRGIGITARHASQTECKRGHRFTVDNTYTDARGRRQCRKCRYLLDSRSKARRRSACHICGAVRDQMKRHLITIHSMSDSAARAAIAAWRAGGEG